MKTDYTISLLPLTEENLKEIQVVLQTCFPKSKKFTLPFLKWQYLDNPLGKAISFNAMYDSKIVAHYACMPICLTINNQKVKGLLDINSATLPDHQGNKLFTRLAEATYQYAKNNGFSFVIGVANQNSIHGYKKYLDFDFIYPLEVRFGLISLTAKKDNIVFKSFWDKDLLLWRLNNPMAKYFCNHNIIYSYRSLFRKDILHIVSDKTILTKKLKSLRGHPISLYVGLNHQLKGLYFKIPSFVSISPFVFIYKDLTEGKLPIPNKDNIVFELIDFDVV